jgi:hypothetical protein
LDRLSAILVGGQRVAGPAHGGFLAFLFFLFGFVFFFLYALFFFVPSR